MAEKASTEDILQELKDMGVKGKEIAALLGIPPSAVTNLYKGTRRLKHEEAMKLINLISGATVKELPVIGMAGAGAWLEAIEDSTTSITVPVDMYTGGTFCVEVSGDSMNIVLPEGSFAIIDPTDIELYNGKLYLLRNHEGEATIKSYRTDPARFEPMSDNPEYVPFLLGSTDLQVIGRVTGSLVKFR